MRKDIFIKFVFFLFVVGVPILSFAEETERIQYKGRIVLGTALKEIADQTGIKFFVSESIAQKSTYVHFRAKNWKSAVQQLLESYSTLALWSNNLTSSKIWVFENDDSRSSADVPILPRQSRPSVVTIPISTNPQVERPQFIASYPMADISITEENPLNQLPPYIRFDPEVLRFLYSKGVEMTPEVKERFGEKLENLPPERQMFSHVRRNPMFEGVLKSLNLKYPDS